MRPGSGTRACRGIAGPRVFRAREAHVETMTAAVLVAHGGPEALEIRHDVPVPRPGDGEIRIEVAAAGVNNTDLWTREGAYGTPDDLDAVVGWKGVPIDFPRIQGGDAVGRVVELGPGAPEHLLGRRVLVDPIVYGQGDDPEEPPIDGVLGSEEDGAFAQHLCVAAERVHDVTDAPLSDTELACLPIAYGTAIGMLKRAAVTAGERVLVTGASGGVGIALVQLAAARGAQVTAVTTAQRRRRPGRPDRPPCSLPAATASDRLDHAHAVAVPTPGRRGPGGAVLPTRGPDLPPRADPPRPGGVPLR